MIQHRQIEAFRAVMSTGSMTGAAGLLGVTQPAVSRLIKDLELELSLALFNRRGNLVTPTIEAEQLLGEVDRSYLGLGNISLFARNLHLGMAGTLTVASHPAMAAGFLPRFVASFYRDRPGVRVIVDGLPSRLVEDRVATGQLELGITSMPLRREALEMIPIADPAVVVVSTKHKLAKKSVIRAQDLEHQSLLLLTTGAYQLHPMAVVLQSIKAHRRIETPQSVIACILASEGA